MRILVTLLIIIVSNIQGVSQTFGIQQEVASQIIQRHQVKKASYIEQNSIDIALLLTLHRTSLENYLKNIVEQQSAFSNSIIPSTSQKTITRKYQSQISKSTSKKAAQIAEEVHKNRTPLTSIQKSSIAKLQPLAINEQTDKQDSEIAAFLGKKAHLNIPTIGKEKSSAEGSSSGAPKQIGLESHSPYLANSSFENKDEKEALIYEQSHAEKTPSGTQNQADSTNKQSEIKNENEYVILKLDDPVNRTLELKTFEEITTSQTKKDSTIVLLNQSNSNSSSSETVLQNKPLQEQHVETPVKVRPITDIASKEKEVKPIERTSVNETIDEGALYDTTFEGVSFYLQVAALSSPKSTQEVEKILGLNEHVERKSIAGLYKYFVPNFSTYREALLKKQSLEHRGVSCFVVAMKTGNVLDIKTLLQVSD